LICGEKKSAVFLVYSKASRFFSAKALSTKPTFSLISADKFPSCNFASPCPEIEQLRRAVFRDQNVRRFQIAVND